MDNKKIESLLKEISFTRISGSEEEKKAANILKREIENIGYKTEFETFEVDYSEVEKVNLELLGPMQKQIQCEGVLMSGSTPIEGIERDLVYIENCEDVNLINVEDKIVLLEGRIFHSIYKKLITAKVAGFIALSGTIYDDEKSTDLLINQIRVHDYNLGYIPGVTIRAKEGQMLASLKNAKVKLTLIQKQSKRLSQNVICEIEGTKHPEEIITFTAHYDSVRFSTGAYDNASGSIGILSLLEYYNKNKPDRTLKFIWCGSEEVGLLGSKAYCNQHEQYLTNCRLNINIDMIGVILGHEIAVVTGENSLVNYIDYTAKEIGIPCKVSQGVYSSDSTPFADKGIPSISFARISPQSGAQIHSRKDVVEPLNAKNFKSTLSLITAFADRVINAFYFPIKKVIPQNMKDELDYYLLRKERPTNN
ncbi:MAG: M28 family peptidase [Bacilli bacterium]